MSNLGGFLQKHSCRHSRGFSGTQEYSREKNVGDVFCLFGVGATISALGSAIDTRGDEKSAFELFGIMKCDNVRRFG